MTLENIYYIGQTIAVLALVLSLVFVGVQILQNTRATRAASHNAVSDSLNEVNRMFAENADLTTIWLKGLSDRQALSAEERWRFDSVLRAYMHVCETMFIQAGLGAGDKGIMLAEADGIRVVMTSPGPREWRDENPYGFCAEFRAYADSLAKSPSAERAQ
jgi:hypothetical protein